MAQRKIEYLVKLASHFH